MGTVVYRGELEIEIAHEPEGFRGRGAVTIKFPPGIKYRLTLEDAESVGDMLIDVVRRAERDTLSK